MDHLNEVMGAMDFLSFELRAASNKSCDANPNIEDIGM
jgi:hypothetical protein